MAEIIHPYHPRLQPLDLNQVSQIQCECGTWDVPKSYSSAGLITFSGEYAYGSGGRHDALFIKWRIHEFIEFKHVSGLVIDFQQLNYEWGDEMSDVIPLDFDGGPKPLRILVSPENKQALSGVHRTEFFSEDFGIACAEINHAVRAIKH